MGGHSRTTQQIPTDDSYYFLPKKMMSLYCYYYNCGEVVHISKDVTQPYMTNPV